MLMVSFFHGSVSEFKEKDTWIMIKKHKQYYALGLSMIIIALITGVPLFVAGVGGDPKDMLYHLLRIESMKVALINGDFPPRLNPIYFNGYGYGSSLFYPDVSLVIPAFLCICGLSVLQSYKVFVLLIAMAGTCTAFFSLRLICHNWKIALTGSYVLMLSTFYLADINSRAGLSEYLACVFVPVLVAGIYDYFTEGKRIYLLGIAFLGMALSHTIMTYIGALITVIIFAAMLFVPGKRRLVFEWGRFKKLVITAMLTGLSAGYYVLPLLEQFVSDRFQFGDPWAQIGNYTQKLSYFFKPVGGFFFTAQLGVGIPVLLLLVVRIFLGKVKDKWADFFMITGVVLLLIMTNIVPWRILENTPLNMIQFTFRFYPYALCFLIWGISAAYSDKRKDGPADRCFLVFIVVISIACGVWEDVYCIHDHEKVEINEEYLYRNSNWISFGEWLPLSVPQAVKDGHGSGMVTAGDRELPWMVKGHNYYSFSIDESNGCDYTLPLIYYKGYRAEIILPDGERQPVHIDRSLDALVKVELQQEMNGVIEVRYAGTKAQRLSNIVSCITVLSIVAGFLVKSIRRICSFKVDNVNPV